MTKRVTATVSEIAENGNYTMHHTASRRGYESRKGCGHVEEYTGRFGSGYIVISPRLDTTSFVNVTYYLAK